MKRVRTVIISVICICLVVGAYYYWSNRNTSVDETEVTEVQKVILKDISGDAYPKTPRAVIKFLTRIQSCYYNEEYTEEELHQLADQVIVLMDQELADNNPAQQYYLRVEQDVESYREKERTINNASVCDTNEVVYQTIDGVEYAYVDVSYFMKEKGGFSRANQEYALRRDDEGRWKILAFELDEGDTENNE